MSDKPLPPLVPQYPTPTADAELVARLAELVEFEHCLASCFRAAIEIVDDRDAVERLAAVRDHSDRAIAAMSSQLSDLGASAPTADEARALLPEGPRDIGMAKTDAEMFELLGQDVDTVLSRYRDAGADPKGSKELRGELTGLATSLKQVWRAVRPA